ncbi:MAG: SDR family oxidoreductase [Deltaproteobacteria bacterium]|nr:SDR family oxidoreductase [Deltaproteobacteria bacterium]
MRGLKDKRVVVTGAGRGIGRATAERFLEEGAVVAAVDLEAPALEHPRVTNLAADVTSDAGLAAIDAWCAEGGVDVLVNNAGITRDGTALKMSDAAWDQVLAVNLTAVFRLARQAAGRMREQGRGGVILNAASVVAHTGNFGQANYVATKAGVIGLTKTLARELGRKGIRVNAVAPGFVKTPMTDVVPEEVLGQMAARTPLGELGEPADIAAAYAFLASDDARYITATCLDVDGGLVV